MRENKKIILEPLTAEAFSSFGQVLTVPTKNERHYFNECLKNTRPEAKPSLSIAKIEPVKHLPLSIKLLERHLYSSQSFIPINAGRYLVIVASNESAEKPDVTSIQAFIAQNNQGITYNCGVWHHPMTVLESHAEMAIFMWCDETEADEQFYTLEHSVQILSS